MKNLLHTIQHLRWDLWLFVVTLGLVLCGIVMVYSASLPSEKGYGLLLNQGKYAIVGIVAMAALMQVNYRLYQNPLLIYVTLGVIAVLLFIALVGPWEINGARRWILLGGFSLQPSELAKAALVVFLAWFLTQREEEGRLEDFWHTVAPAGMVTAILAGLIVKEPDLGTTLMLGAVFVIMIFAVGLPLRHLLRVLPLMLPVLLYLIMRVGWRWERVLAFWNPEQYAQGKGYQAWQSLIAVGTGGVDGLGLGQSKQKLFYLPEAHSDFIFAVIGEELGLVGAATLVAAFGFFFYRCYRVSRHAPDRFGQLLVLGFATAIVVQAFFNISVSLSMVPTKGIPLPFISAGGTSLLVTMATVGVMLNISAHCVWGERESGRAGEKNS
jgi:cell division protein FtsW